jgi:hypothetical protein
LLTIRGSRRGARGILIGALLAAFCLASADRASALAEPIIGTWDASGAQIEVVQTRPGFFQGTVVGGSFGACNNQGVVWKQMSGGGYGYTGTIPFVHVPGCSSAGDGYTTFSLSSINSGTWSGTSPGDGMVYSGPMTRTGNFDIAAFVENIRQKLTGTCDVDSIVSNPNGCGKAPIRNPQFWKANGSLICATGTALSGSKHFTPITTGAAVNGCVKDFPPPKRQARVSRVRTARHPTPARAKAGTYAGVSIGLSPSGQVPAKKQLRRRGRTLAAFLRSHKKPHNANPISFKVGKHGRSITFSPGLSLTCEDGTSLPVDLTDLPDPTAPLSVPRKGYFRIAAEDPVITARTGGFFLNKRSLAGSLYVAAHTHQHGLCESWVGFAARKG